MNVQIVSNENWPQLEAAASSTVLLIPEIFIFFTNNKQNHIIMFQLRINQNQNHFAHIGDGSSARNSSA